MELEIDKMLTCSIGHMTQDEADDMDSDHSEIGRLRSIWKCDYGFMFWIGEAKDANHVLGKNLDGTEIKLSKGLREAIVFAVQNECKYIRFDRDAHPLPGVHVYDW